MLPNFLVVGAQKAGTTSLHHFLQAHPEIYLPEQKETKFFVHDRFYEKGIRHYEQTYFSARQLQLAVGEVDPDYMYCEQSAHRIAKDLDISTLKLIFIFRNPVDRAFSQYLMNYRRGHEALRFEEAIAAESSRIQQGHMDNLRYSYATRGLYFKQLERFLKYVDATRIHCLLSDDLESAPMDVVRQVFEFLGVDADFCPSNIEERFHQATVPRSAFLARSLAGKGRGRYLLRHLIPSATIRTYLRERAASLNQTRNSRIVLDDRMRRQLVEFFRDGNTRLGAFLGRDLSHWSA